ncbi:MAG: MFS transporter, partial [Gammaproteobacteria bacterium]|nr:MFS transporter [Gammaproteobacteria bacterium]
PFIAILSRDLGGAALSDLGVMVLASGIAASVSASFWGRWSDVSSRRVMAAGGTLAAFAGLVAAAAAFVWSQGGAWAAYFFGAVYFVLAVAHTGVRLGRKTHLVDMAGSDKRASYVAVSNTLIGIVLLFGGAAGVLGDAAGPAAVVLLFAILSALGAASSLRLEEVQK